MTTKSILKHPYWLPPENGKTNPHYDRFCLAATKCYRKWLGQWVEQGKLSQEEFNQYIQYRMQDIPGTPRATLLANRKRNG